MATRIKPAWPAARLAAPAYAVVCGRGDNLAVHVAVAEAPVGCALVVDAHEPSEIGYWGEVLTTAAESRGLAGLVIDGCVRDVAALAAHGFAVFCAGVALPGARKKGGGSVGGAATVGGVEVTTGDWVVGDADGVTVVPAASLDDVLTAATARAERESGMFDRLRAGATTLELLGLDPSPVSRP